METCSRKFTGNKTSFPLVLFANVYDTISNHKAGRADGVLSGRFKQNPSGLTVAATTVADSQHLQSNYSRG
jgi:hypothetical protein